MKIVVLGGAGMMGCIAVQDLARSEGVGSLQHALVIEQKQRLGRGGSARARAG